MNEHYERMIYYCNAHNLRILIVGAEVIIPMELVEDFEMTEANIKEFKNYILQNQ